MRASGRIQIQPHTVNQSPTLGQCHQTQQMKRTSLSFKNSEPDHDICSSVIAWLMTNLLVRPLDINPDHKPEILNGFLVALCWGLPKINLLRSGHSLLRKPSPHYYTNLYTIDAINPNRMTIWLEMWKSVPTSKSSKIWRWIVMRNMK